ncbi:hypothetical protein C497_00065 [Halalkalicoccus jeotgali B3]|uniref:Uncharacterized protein n=1 Tax=Halalkalicoccus jeotgali (strain DSM 18796 / CECT 7217 / JCM 14584 / KCTC 4019 / B3) TaxID=795797 RepID=D8JD85_HALJB|nr:hypothetical protein HacjB3_19513 [Halalkalicoccus jeotgali B3]ELY41949.1 hypothetical protein C497_00065 [Halalkalicoccus jeotgali B3]
MQKKKQKITYFSTQLLDTQTSTSPENLDIFCHLPEKSNLTLLRTTFLLIKQLQCWHTKLDTHSTLE